MNSIIYAIGDIHGRSDVMADMYEIIERHHRTVHDGKPATLLHIGDYIDRGGDARGVIDRAMKGIPGFETVSLLGNHEAMMLECTQTDDPDAWNSWLQNGGLATLASFGVSFGQGGNDPELLRNAIGEERMAWLNGLKLYHETEDKLFVHAGIRPGIPLAEQDTHDLIWIRYDFLDDETDHGRLVVHGHTPNKAVEKRSNRLNIDTGVVHYGRLTAAVLEPGADPIFLYATGKPGRGSTP